MRRPVLRYHGSKFRLANWVISFFGPHDLYLEPFGGTGSVLIHKPRSRIEIFNDLNDDVVNLFRVLRDPLKSQMLELQLRLTPFARSEYHRCRGKEDGHTEIERARRLVVRSFQGHGGDSAFAGRNSGFRISATQNRCSSKDWVSYWEAIKGFTHRLSGVIIECKDAFDLMARFDSPTALFYLDPPYVLSTRNNSHKYPNDFNEADHQKLVDFIKTLKAQVILSGYRNKLYDQLHWDSFDCDAVKDKAVPAIETLWLNERALNSTEPLFAGARANGT